MVTPSKKRSPGRSLVRSLVRRYRAFMERRPHRSFRPTRRRDYVRPLELPGYVAFTHEVTKLLWRHKGTFAGLALVYVVLYALLVGVQSQDTFNAITDTVQATGGEVLSTGWGVVGQAGLLFLTVASSGFTIDTTEAQQIFAVLILLMTWLATVWLIRNILAGHKVKLRDSLYNSGAPLLTTVCIALVMAVQLIPVAVAAIGYSAALASGLIDAGGAGAMLFWIAAGLLAVLSLYWITASLFAMTVVTLPGMYPYQAIRIAGDVMLGRRTKILLRWLWMGAVVVCAVLVTVVPCILLDIGLKSWWPPFAAVPLVPIIALLAAALSAVWVSAYVYLLYRKVVDYEPAQ